MNSTTQFVLPMYLDNSIKNKALLFFVATTNIFIQQTLMSLLVRTEFSSVAQSCLTLCDHESQHARPPCPITSSRSLLKLMPVESVIPSSHLILCRYYSPQKWTVLRDQSFDIYPYSSSPVKIFVLKSVFEPRKLKAIRGNGVRDC